MQNRKIKLYFTMPIIPVFLIVGCNVVAEERVIQKESISFEKCLNVITTSEDKLSIAPEITTTSNQKRVAVFSLIDGTLTITCDGEESIVTVSINTD